MTRRKDLDARRAALLARSAQLRAQMTAEGRQMAGRFAGAGLIARTVRSVSARPMLLAGAAVVLALVAGPRRALHYAGRASTLLGLARKVLRLTGSSRS